MRNEGLGESSLMRRSSGMKRRVTRIYVVVDRMEEVHLVILAACPDPNRMGGETRYFIHPSPDRELIA